MWDDVNLNSYFFGYRLQPFHLEMKIFFMYDPKKNSSAESHQKQCGFLL